MPGLSVPAQVRDRRRLAGERRRRRCDSGAALLVYPGGDYEVHRPTWERHRVDFDGRKGFIRLALDRGRADRARRVDRRPGDGAVPLPRRAAWRKLLGLDRAFRLKVLPISLALPWGLNVGDLLGHIPLPAKIIVEALPPIHLREEFGPDPDVDEIYDHVLRLMQETLDALAAERRFPVHRMRVGATIEVAAPARGGLGVRRRSVPLPALHVRRHALGGRRRPAARASARATGCCFRVGLGRGRRADRGRRVRPRTATSRGRRSPASTSAGAGACASARRPHARRAAARPTASPARACSAGSPSGSPPRPCAATCARSLQQLKRQVEHEQLRRRRRRSAASARGPPDAGTQVRPARPSPPPARRRPRRARRSPSPRRSSP